jgi:hypothetical protein
MKTGRYMDAEDRAKMQRLWETTVLSKVEIAARMGCSRSKVAKMFADYRDADWYKAGEAKRRAQLLWPRGHNRHALTYRE